jgi:CBS domain-containing protein
LAEKVDSDSVGKVTISVASVLVFIVSVYILRDIASYLRANDLAQSNYIIWYALLIELVLGAAAGLGSYYVVLKFLISKGLIQKLIGIPISDSMTKSKAEDQVAITENVSAAKSKLPSAYHNLMTVLSPQKDVVGVVSDYDLFRKHGETVKDVMTPNPISVSLKRDDLFTAYKLMINANRDVLPVFDEREGKKVQVGWIALRDVIKRLT